MLLPQPQITKLTRMCDQKINVEEGSNHNVDHLPRNLEVKVVIAVCAGGIYSQCSRS
jgi:hypothetical protein